MNELSDRIKMIRKELGISQVKLASVLGCTDGKIKAWEQGTTTTIKPKDGYTLADTFGLSRIWVMDGKGEMSDKEGQLLLKDISEVQNLLDNNISIDFYKDINASAGHGCTNGECKATKITISKDMLPQSSNNMDAIRVSGNSMTPTIQDEDIIFIDKNQLDPINGKIYVVFLCDEVYVKRLFIEPKTKEIILNSDNPIFPQLKADCEDFRIIGMVIANMQISKL